MTVLAVGGDVDDVTQIALHGQGGIETVERIDHEVAVAQPTEAVIPRAAAVRRLRDGGGHGRDDGPGIVVGVELQGDRGADHGILPFERDPEVADPLPPVGLGLLGVAAAELGNPALDRLIRPQYQGEGGIQHKGSLIDDGAE